jgi:hypothetical protein
MLSESEGLVSAADETRAGPKPKRKSSAVSSGRKLFVTGQGNSAWSRRYRDLIAGHVADAAGRDMMSEAEFSLVRRAAAIECELELMEGKLSMGEEINLDVFTRSASHLRRILETLTLGLGRKQRDVTPSLADIAAEIEADKREVAA